MALRVHHTENIKPEYNYLFMESFLVGLINNDSVTQWKI